MIKFRVLAFVHFNFNMKFFLHVSKIGVPTTSVYAQKSKISDMHF